MAPIREFDRILYRYWGKAISPQSSDSSPFHFLIYHCLDVAAVANAWWQNSPALRDTFTRACRAESEIVKAWVLFFVALHDLGKWDVRFQLKAAPIAIPLNPLYAEVDQWQSSGFDHGHAGLSWFLTERTNFELYEQSEEWMRAVASHHGQAPGWEPIPKLLAAQDVITQDQLARREFVGALRGLFLGPISSFHDWPELSSPQLLAGFCSVCDWIGSNTDFFPYCSNVLDIGDYFRSLVGRSEQALRETGLLRQSLPTGGMGPLFPKMVPRGIQPAVESWPLAPGLTIIEAPTGSGKTEAAVAYASRLLANGLAESLIYALPTQATANAMLPRLDEIAERFFPQGANLVLAHGKARFHPGFQKLRERGLGNTVQRNEEAQSQCAQWLASSRKRLFLGQIGICTVDQILLSVLPIRHNFVRSFGLHKSILIVDEVHAYDSYMNGLLDAVLERQKQSEGTVILLSATLPEKRRREIFKIWSGSVQHTIGIPPYPLISNVNASGTSSWTTSEGEQQRIVNVEIGATGEMLPEDSLLDRVIQAAVDGAQVALICNLVKDAQVTARRLLARAFSINAGIGISLFHSRFRFCDRQRIEETAIRMYGKDAPRKRGSILVATQVVEQSLDIDFDWIITQLCPVDLLFQRLGRLHRHVRLRPLGFETPQCLILVPSNNAYGNHQLIYGDSLVLWRTEKLLQDNSTIFFPDSYRTWIESVYDVDLKGDEPEFILAAHDEFVLQEQARRFAARQLSTGDINSFSDTSENATALTRDGEMSLNVIPLVRQNKSDYFLDGARLSGLREWEADEALNLNSIPVPASWRKYLPTPSHDGYFYLPLHETPSGSWRSVSGGPIFIYDVFSGLERHDEPID